MEKTKEKNSIQKIAIDYIKAHEYAIQNNDPCCSWLDNLDDRLLPLLKEDDLHLIKFWYQLEKHTQDQNLVYEIMSMLYTRINRIKEKLKQRSKKNGNKTKRFYPKDSK